MVSRERQLYALGCLNKAVDALVAGEGDLRSRLVDAYECISPLTSCDLPKDLRADLAWIKEQLTIRQPTESETQMGIRRLEATRRHTQNKTRVPIAHRLHELQIKIQERLWPRQG